MPLGREKIKKILYIAILFVGLLAGAITIYEYWRVMWSNHIKPAISIYIESICECQSKCEAEICKPETRKCDFRVVSGETVDDIRSKNGVRGIDKTEQTLKISDLDNGVFGFSAPQQYNKQKSMTLGKNQGGAIRMEVQKTANGEIHALFFVSIHDRTELKRSNLQYPRIVYAHFSKSDDTPYPVSIPLCRIMSLDDKRDILRVEIY